MINRIALLLILIGTTATAVCQESRPLEVAVDTKPAWTTFNSKQRLVVEVDGREFATPAPGDGIRVPVDRPWSVRPGYPIGLKGWRNVENREFESEHLATLVEEIREKRVPGLSLVGCARLTGKDLTLLRKCPDLTHLDLDGRRGQCGPDISGASLAELSHLRKLRDLCVRGVGTTRRIGDSIVDRTLLGPVDVDFGFLSALPDIEVLDMSFCPRLTGEVVKFLKDLSRLRELDLSWTAFDDYGAAELCRWCGNLTQLRVSKTALSDAGLARLSTLRSLRVLDINGCRQLTDDGLMQLAPMKGLEKLVCEWGGDTAPFSQQGLRRLANAMPGCTVVGIHKERPRVSPNSGPASRPLAPESR